MNMRRRFLNAGFSGVGLAIVAGAPRALAAALNPTPTQAQGPFYPKRLPSDVDFDLTHIEGKVGVAVGEITVVSGRVLDVDGRPISGARIEVWQVNGHGRYHHEDDDSDRPLDPNFQGYGTFLSNDEGRYSFRTVKPIAYPGRAPHIHFIVRPSKGRPLVTQMYLADSPENDKDFLLRSVRDPKLRESLIVALQPARGGGELEGEFNLVLAAS